MRKFLAGVMLATTFYSQPVFAQLPCAPRAEVVELLHDEHDETAIAFGVTSSGDVLELWTSDRGVSWSIIVTLPSGVACVLVVGQAWENLIALPDGKHL